MKHTIYVGVETISKKPPGRPRIRLEYIINPLAPNVRYIHHAV
jgi:hypothetical protein